MLAAFKAAFLCSAVLSYDQVRWAKLRLVNLPERRPPAPAAR
jgi:hypothetical protein